VVGICRSHPVLKKLAEKLGLGEAELPGAEAHDGDAGPEEGRCQRRAGASWDSKADTTVNVYMQQIEAGVKQTLDAIYSELTTPEVAAGM
jgi:hypothetical protein